MTDADVSRLYPELASGGRLAAAMIRELHLIGSRVQIEDPLGSAYAIAKTKRRKCQTHVAMDRRAFGADLWDRGVLYGHVWSSNLGRVALLLHSFLQLEAPTSELERIIPELEVPPEALAHERGALVDFRWEHLLAKRPPDWPEALLHDVFLLAAARRFRALMPFTSLTRACFSTRTGYPYTRDCPAIEVLHDSRCKLFLPNQMDGGDPVFVGELAEAVARAESLLSSDITAAFDGTAEDDAA